MDPAMGIHQRDEWEYLEGHKDLYKDVMMDNQPPLISLDGSSNGNPPERCPCPLYSRDSTQEDHTIPCQYQGEILINIKEEDIEEEEINMKDDESCMEEEHPPEISTDGHIVRKTMVEPLISSPHCDLEVTSLRQDSTMENMEDILPGLLGHQDPEGSSTRNPDTTFKHNQPEHSSGSGTPEPSSPDEAPPDTTDAMTLHTAYTDKNRIYPCSECGKTFVLQHIFGGPQRTSTAVEPFTCCECQKLLSLKPELGQLREGNSKAKRFACSECGKRFSRRCYLFHHESIHAGNCENQCSECGKCFTNKSNLVVHYRSHTGEKPYPCTECEKRFTHRSTLVKHLRIHTGERPYSCLYCGKGFAQKSGIDRHQRIHMKEVSTIII
ncbi:unnamed protein product [Staurois parvus]|uniref:C2H2-type domain-containing protein n=1 Tax=Staurois parvus TaxID=386267 RepID=A0ABN9CJ67_9NEOB|nr:unnamed protein product [Staurois parvus]